MDNMAYSYVPNKNQLDKVVDAAPDAAASDYDKYNDIKKFKADGITPAQANANYTYDAIGNLISDVSEGITNITWSVYGKILSITKATGTITYNYDASGNRVSKTSPLAGGGGAKTTLYVRDASGNVMAVYENLTNAQPLQKEVHLYGSSRLGILTDLTVPPTYNYLANGGFGVSYFSTFTRGEKIFELSNHLGNVLVTVSDKKLAVDSDNDGVVNYYNADVVTASDYYPGGMQMPGRKYNSDKAVYGFNGKRKDNEMYGEGNAYDFDNRIYDPRLVHWLSVDKLQAKHPGESPYLYCGGSPIVFIDPDGKDRIITHSITYEYGNGKSLTITRTRVIKGEYLKYKADNGKYFYYDQHETTSKFIQVGKGTSYEGGSSVTTGALRGDSDYDLDTWSGKAKHAIFEKSFEQKSGESFRDGGGIMFTSSSGEGGGPKSKYRDAKPENIDLLVAALAISETALKTDILNSVIDKLEYLKDAINTVSDLKDAGPLTIDIKDMNKKTAPMAPNTTKCLTCEGGYHGIPAVRSGADGSVKDTLKPNGAKVDTIPTIR